MDTHYDETEKHIFKSTSGSKEKKGGKKKNPKTGWYIFLFLIFLTSYGYFTFVYFK